MTMLIVVADEREALLYETDGLKAPFELVARIENPTARLHDRDLESDRPGRSFNSTTGQSSAMDGERSTRRAYQVDFARRIADEVEHGRTAQRFDRIALIAGPRMLGLIRESLSAPAGQLTVAEVPKDLVHSDEPTIREYVPREAFYESARPS